ncbi:MAG TPA: sigma-70 family RNA polymerase sigma factor [Solirubrobacteraceae bacterium]|nr:sigma-70 family RNA polymerase sigma factor [Solirubrobacteraceae bacterium]
MAAQCEELLREHFPDGLVRTLGRTFPGSRQDDCEDATSEAFAKMIRKGRALENPRGYVTTVAMNEMRRVLVKAAREQLPESQDEEGKADAWADPTAEEAIGEAVFRFVRGIVEKWESRNLRLATLVVLEAGKLGEPLSSAELAEELEHQLGDDVSPDTARQWRKRGLDRLREQLHAADPSIAKERR